MGARWSCAVAAYLSCSSVPAARLLCPNETEVHGATWPARYWSNDCIIRTSPSPNRSSTSKELKIMVFGPYAGPVGDAMTAMEPFLAMAAQEVEDSGLLPGYRLSLELIDTRCRWGPALWLTHTLSSRRIDVAIGGMCDDDCQAIHAFIYWKFAFMLAPACTGMKLSAYSYGNAATYPFFARLAPSSALKVRAIFEQFRLLRWFRFGLVYGPQPAMRSAKDEFLGLVSKDSGGGWVALFSINAPDSRGADAAGEQAARQGARIIVGAVLEDLGAQLLCACHRRGLLPPSYVHVQLAGLWSADFLQSYAGQTLCSEEQLWRAGFASLGFDDRGVWSSPERHGLSGRPLAEIMEGYATECARFAGGRGHCDVGFGAYYYDAVWHVAWTLHRFLVTEGRPKWQLLTLPGRRRMTTLALERNYLGLTGRVRQKSSGDRAGSVLIWQMTSPANNPFTLLGYWEETGPEFVNPLHWDPDNRSLLVHCFKGCNDTLGWIPADRGEDCPAGRARDSGGECLLCAPGSYVATVRATACSACEVGRFANATGRSACEACAPGSVSRQPGASACSSCPPGSFVDSFGASACHYCPRGTYADTEQATRCQRCVDLPHPLPTTANLASQKASDCGCDVGSYQLLVGGGCRTCPQGLDCPAGTVEPAAPSPATPRANGTGGSPPKVKPGYFTKPEEPLSVYRCAQVRQCLGGGPKSCAENNAGQVCGRCKADHFMSREGLCSRCNPVPSGKYLLPTIPFVVGPPVVLVVAWLDSDLDSWNNPIWGVMSVLFVALGYTQTVAMYALMQLQLPSTFSSTSEPTSYTLLPLEKLHIECYSSVELRKWVKYLTPLLLLLVFVLAYAWNLVLCKLCPSCPRLGDAIISSFGSLYFNVFMLITQEALSQFACYNHPNGERSMRSSPTVLCGRDLWRNLTVASIFAILVFCVLAVVVMAWLLWIAPSRYHLRSFRMRTKFLMYRYRTEFGFWSLVLLVKSIWINLSIVLFFDAPGQLVWMNTGLLVYTLATNFYCPFRIMAASVVDVVAHAWICFLHICTALVVDIGEEDRQRQGVVSSAVALSMYGCVVAAVCWQVWMAYWQRRYAAGYRQREAQRICKAMKTLCAEPEKLARVIDHLSFVEVRTLQKAACLVLREPDRAGSLRAAQGPEAAEAGVVGAASAGPEDPAAKAADAGAESEKPDLQQDLSDETEDRPQLQDDDRPATEQSCAQYLHDIGAFHNHVQRQI